MNSFDDPRYLSSYPVSFVLRETHPETWFRIHSLPDSKRYPETESEWAVLIDRHQQVSNKILSPASFCQVHYYLFADEAFPQQLEPSLDWHTSRVLPVYEDQSVFVRTATAHWDFDTFLPWIKLRSNDELAWISFHSLETDSIYSPYDGGADLFSNDSDFLDEVRYEFSAWKSNHPTGL